MRGTSAACGTRAISLVVGIQIALPAKGSFLGRFQYDGWKKKGSFLT